jgi:uncharacterized membrane-anchored protein
MDLLYLAMGFVAALIIIRLMPLSDAKEFMLISIVVLGLITSAASAIIVAWSLLSPDFSQYPWFFRYLLPGVVMSCFAVIFVFILTYIEPIYTKEAKENVILIIGHGFFWALLWPLAIIGLFVAFLYQAYEVVKKNTQ